jgi:hypothetical protein
MTPVGDDVDGLDDIRMSEGGTNAEFCSDLLLVFLFALTGPLGPELLDSKGITTMLSLYQPDSATRARTEDSTPFAILLGEMSLCSLGE